MKVISVNISKKKGTLKNPVPEINITENGINEDAHTGVYNREISLLSIEKIDRFSAESGGRKFSPGEFAENITYSDTEDIKIEISDRFLIGDAILEVTQIGKKCHGDRCVIFNELGRCVMPKEGIFCRVVKGGSVKPGDEINFQKGR